MTVPVPTEIAYRQDSRVLVVSFPGDERYELGAEFLRELRPLLE